MNRYAVIADDFTGAGDSGVHFAAAGKKTALLLDRAALTAAFAEHEAVAVSAESRFLSPAAAAAAVTELMAACRLAGAGVFFKKIDSTLRGNPGAEIEAALGASGCAAALVCAAMPKTGRTVRNGTLLLRGTPIHESEMGRDPFNPVRAAGAAAILSEQTSLPAAALTLGQIRAGGESLAREVGAMTAGGIRLLLADACEDGDLEILGALLRDSLAGGTLPRLLPAGAGGLAEAFAGPAKPSSEGEAEGRMLAVAGSLTETTLSQIEYAAERDIFFPLDLDMAAAMTDEKKETERLAGLLSRAGTRHLLLKNRTLPAEARNGISAEDGVKAAGIFGRTARMLCGAAGCQRLYVTGGSTAVAAADALGLGMVTLRRESLPGVAVSSCDIPGLPLKWFITKAGGFGGPETLAQLAEGTVLPAGTPNL